ANAVKDRCQGGRAEVLKRGSSFGSLTGRQVVRTAHKAGQCPCVWVCNIIYAQTLAKSRALVVALNKRVQEFGIDTASKVIMPCLHEISAHLGMLARDQASKLAPLEIFPDVM